MRPGSGDSRRFLWSTARELAWILRRFTGEDLVDGGFSGGASVRGGCEAGGLPAAVLLKALWSDEDGGVLSTRVDGGGDRHP